MKILIKIMLLPILVLILVSCDIIPKFSDSVNKYSTEIFIVSEIDEYQKNSKFCYYVSYHNLPDRFQATVKLPIGWFNIGDTILLTPKKWCDAKDVEILNLQNRIKELEAENLKLKNGKDIK